MCRGTLKDGEDRSCMPAFLFSAFLVQGTIYFPLPPPPPQHVLLSLMGGPLYLFHVRYTPFVTVDVQRPSRHNPYSWAIRVTMQHNELLSVRATMDHSTSLSDHQTMGGMLWQVPSLHIANVGPLPWTESWTCRPHVHISALRGQRDHRGPKNCI